MNDGTERVTMRLLSSSSLITSMDLIRFSVALEAAGLILFILYLWLPRAVRKQYFGSYPKRHAWMAKQQRSSDNNSQQVQPTPRASGRTHMLACDTRSLPVVSNVGTDIMVESLEVTHSSAFTSANATAAPNVSTELDRTMSILYNPGVVLIAHGTRGAHRTVKIQLTNKELLWSRKSVSLAQVHRLPLSLIQYVDVGKNTAALSRPDNQSVPENLCMTLLTKGGSLDLQAQTPQQRDLLVACFEQIITQSLVQGIATHHVAKNGTEAPNDEKSAV